MNDYPQSGRLARSKPRGDGLRILWIDDLIHLYEPYARDLENHGFQVARAASVQEARKELEGDPFDVIVADVVMPGMDGDVFIENYIKSSRSRSSKTRFAILSSYLNEEEIRSRLKRLKSKVFVLEKSLGEPNTEEFERRFVNKLVEITKARHPASPKAYLEKLEAHTRKADPFRMSFETFENLPVYSQRALAKRASRQARPTLKKHFADGAVWILLCGSKTEPKKVVKQSADIPTRNKIRDLARKINRAYFAIRAPTHVDEIAIAGPCAGEGNPKYPTVTLSLGPVNTEPVQVHFDTGSPHTFFDFEFIEKRGLAPLDPNWETLARDHGPTHHEEDWDVFEFVDGDSVLYDQMTRGTTGIRLRGLAVNDWKKTSLAKRCNRECPLRIRGRAGFCAHRVGIIGRDFLFLNNGERAEDKLGIILHDQNNLTSFCRDWKAIADRLAGAPDQNR
jgi:CheY-like chemotaxis protein